MLWHSYRRRRWLALGLLGALTWAAAPAGVQEVMLDKPVAASVQVREPKETVAGKLVKYDDETLTVQTSKGERQLKWADLVPASAYAARLRTIDTARAEDWLALGTLAWGLGAEPQAKTALARAAKLDPALKEKADAVLAGKSGSLVATTRPASGEADAPDGGDAPAKAGELLRPQDDGDAPAGPPVKYQKSTPEQDKAMIEQARARSAAVAEEMSIEFAEIQTAHFIIFTDWDAREHGFLEKNLEAAYAAVSRQFDIPAKENVFVGKLPVYMFRGKGDFLTFAATIDGFAGVTESVAGYYQSRGDGFGHMVMWKPLYKHASQRRAAEEQWAYVLVHEFTHAFVARYRSNGRVPTWLNEGVAEVIASSCFPRDDALRYASGMAKEFESVQRIFGPVRPTGEWYPVMRTLVETLVKKDRRAFLKFFDDVKDGKDPEEALREHYKWDYRQFEQVWRQYVKQFEVMRH